MGLMARSPLDPHPKHPRPLTEEWSPHTHPRGLELGPLLLIRGIVVEVAEELRLNLRPEKGLIQARGLRGQCWTQEKQCQTIL
jgi:hypothetical protein